MSTDFLMTWQPPRPSRAKRAIPRKSSNQFVGQIVVRKGENDPAARATVTLDEFLHWLTRRIVDVYHTRRPETLGKKSPFQTWNEAVALSPPLIRTDQTMLRSAFGITTTRKATRRPDQAAARARSICGLGNTTLYAMEIGQMPPPATCASCPTPMMSRLDLAFACVLLLTMADRTAPDLSASPTGNAVGFADKLSLTLGHPARIAA